MWRTQRRRLSRDEWRKAQQVQCAASPAAGRHARRGCVARSAMFAVTLSPCFFRAGFLSGLWMRLKTRTEPGCLGACGSSYIGTLLRRAWAPAMLLHVARPLLYYYTIGSSSATSYYANNNNVIIIFAVAPSFSRQYQPVAVAPSRTGGSEPKAIAGKMR